MELLKIHLGDVSDLKNAYQKVLASLKKFLLPDTPQANINDLETLSSKSNEHHEVLVLLGDFLLFDESTNVEAHKKNKSSLSLKVFNEEGTMQGDLPLINRKAGVSSEGDLEGKKVDEGESLILEKGKYL
ncbi:hypothetical protein NBO_2g0079 [Nosema bombycis CQ1]|uniref:Uncharacterized protein n=1 Tax=Nosema bombycis (strain CQ1 / CVCC 102059) TaxID=578461 RepID=R0MRQ9_NOSB1|nr:hypothetical protein NBO_2g0079 [Nosema bombycis CQ1]|eukprot:EOB15588.1 hypothetical protein NBO_2g0079 [Nosema bombycis CQ1]